MTTLAEFTREILDPIGIWVGLIISIPVFWTWFDVVFGRGYRHRRWWKAACSTTGRLPAVLIVDCLPGRDIRAVVQRYMAGHEVLKDVPADRVVYLGSEKHLRPENMPAMAREIQDKAAVLLQMGADEIFVFIAAPVSVSAMVGAELANVASRVHLMQNDQTKGTYEDFGPLRHPRF